MARPSKTRSVKADNLDRPKKRDGFASERIIRRSREWCRTVLKSPISREFCITDIGHFPETRFHWIDRTKGINEHILIHNRSGTGRAFIGNRSWVIPPQHILLIPAGTPHSYGADEQAPWSIYWLHFIGRSSKQILELLGISRERPLISVDRVDGLLPLFEATLEIASRKVDPENAAILSEKLLQLVNRIPHKIHERDRPEARIDPRIEAALNYMRNHLTRTCSLEEIAREVGLSVPQFSNLFRSHTGTSPLRFFTRWRMQRAARWLVESQEPISAISERIGYQDSFYFCRVFRQYVGLSPKQYRQHLKAKETEKEPAG